MAKKLVYTTNTPSATTDYAAADGTWKTMSGGGSGTVTSVALTAPTAFNVSGSPITTSGTIAISGAGTASQYVKGDGTLGTTATSLPPSGSAGGDLSGTYPNPTVSKIYGVDMQSGTPSVDEVWVYGGSPAKWQHQKLQASQVSNDSTVGGTNVDNALDNLKLSIALKQDAITLTTTGTSGAATLVGSTLNIPQYTSLAVLQAVYGGTTLSTGQIAYAAFENIGGVLTNENTRRVIMPVACTMSKFYTVSGSTQPATGSLTLTIRKNIADTILVITIAAGSVGGTYSNTTNSVSFAAGDAMAIKFVNNATSTSASIISVSSLLS